MNLGFLLCSFLFSCFNRLSEDDFAEDYSLALCSYLFECSPEMLDTDWEEQWQCEDDIKASVWGRNPNTCTYDAEKAYECVYILNLLECDDNPQDLPCVDVYSCSSI